MRASRRSMLFALCAVSVGALWFWVERTGGPVDSSGWLLLAALTVSFAAVDLVPLVLPRGASLRMNGGVAVAAMVLVSPPQAVVAYALGAGVSMIAVGHGRIIRVSAVEYVRRGATLGLVAVLYAAARAGAVLSPEDATSVVMAFLGGCTYLICDVAGYAVWMPSDSSESPSGAALGLLRLIGSAYLGQVSVGVVLALVYLRLGILAFPILVVLMLIMQHSFSSLLQLRGAHTRTVSALVRLAEIQRPHAEGHAERVSHSAAALGRRLGLSHDRLELLTLSALLHDIGMVGLGDEEQTTGAAAVSAAGVALVSKVGFLAGLAPIISRQADDFSAQGLDSEPEALLAQILRVCSDYDEATARVGEEAALTRIRDGAGTLYNPLVVKELATWLGSGAPSDAG